MSASYKIIMANIDHLIGKALPDERRKDMENFLLKDPTIKFKTFFSYLIL